ncbi:MAG: carboxy terminal-processing peptidase [Planctomycetaceae bacterium]|nr:carboxy terminal-processing peptidase [Planctomycetaceae bacterium]
MQTFSMKQSSFHRTFICLLLSLVLFLTACQRETSGQPLSPPANASAQSAGDTALLPLVPSIREGSIAWLYVNVLEKQHISQKKLDADTSKEAFRLYLKALDPLKMYFYQSDIDKFRKNYETQFCEFAKQKNVKPAFEIYNLFLDRIKEREKMIQEILKTQQDFTLDEEIITDKDLLQYPKTTEEAYDRWRKRIKHDILRLKFDAREKQKEREKAAKEGKEPPKRTKDADRDPIERLSKRYAAFKSRMLLETHISAGEILDNIKRAANDEVMETYLSSISGAIDPHTSYMSPSTLENFEIQMKKALDGIGATLTSEDGYTVIKKLTKGGPAHKSDALKTDDKIRGVGQGKDGEIVDVVDSRLSDVVKLIRGPKDTIVRLEVIPADGGPVKIIEIVRDKVNLEEQAAKKAVFEVGKKPDGSPYKIGWIDLPDFYLDMDAFRKGDPNPKSSTSDIRNFLEEFVKQNVDAVVLDLRMNGGGSLTEAITLTGLFIETGNVVQTKDETSSRPQQRDDPDAGCAWTGPLVVVENKFSASASEIFAGAIKDYKRGLIVGDSKTHGKGTVQQMKDLSEGLFYGNIGLGVIKITIQGFYHPSGTSPQRDGVEADVILPSIYDVLEEICEADLDNALTLNKVSAAKNFPASQKTAFVTPEIAAKIQQLSDERTNKQEDFVKLRKEIENYKEIKAKKTSTVNEKKYFEEQERYNADIRDRDKSDDSSEEDETIKKDFYVDEVLALTSDYIKLLEQLGIRFPDARTVKTPNSSPLNFLFNR